MPWKTVHTALVLAFIVVIAGLGVIATQLDLSNRHAHLGFWGMVLLAALLVGLLVTVGHGVAGRLDGALIGEGKRMSLANFQIAAWTVVVLSAYGGTFLTNLLASDGPDVLKALDVSIPPELWLAMGISSSSLVGAKLIIAQKGVKGTPHNNATDARWGELFVADDNRLDLAKVQMFFLTVVLTFGYAAAVSERLINATTPIAELPKLNEAFVILLAISHSGYLARKVVD